MRPGALLRFAPAIALAVFALLCLSQSAFAQASNPGQGYDNVAQAFQNATNSWIAPLQTIASSVFWSLALIELILVAVPLALKGADLGEFAYALVKLILFLGFFYALVLKGAYWMNDIVRGFVQAGNSVSGASATSLGGILDQGVQVALKIWDGWSIWHGDGIGTAVILALGSIWTLACYVVMAVSWAIAMFESYFIIGAATLFFALGGSQFTSHIARQVFMAALGIGAKLFVIELMIGTGQSIIQQWVAAYNNDAASLFGLMALLFMFALGVVMIPNVVMRLMGGHPTGNPLGAMMAGIGAAAGATSVFGGAAALGGSAAGSASPPGGGSITGVAGAGTASTGAEMMGLSPSATPAPPSDFGGPLSGMAGGAARPEGGEPPPGEPPAPSGPERKE